MCVTTLKSLRGKGWSHEFVYTDLTLLEQTAPGIKEEENGMWNDNEFQSWFTGMKILKTWSHAFHSTPAPLPPLKTIAFVPLLQTVYIGQVMNSKRKF